MVTPLSSLVWQIITPLQKIQFPVRWLPVMSMCGALVAVASFQYFLKGKFHKQRIWVYASGLFGIALCIFNTIYVIHPMSFVPISREKFEAKAMTPINAESFSFWWAIWSKNVAFTTTDKILADERSSKIITWEAEERVFEITEGNAENVRVATFYYPHWQATVNDQPVTVGKDENGVILIPVPKENSLVKLTFREPFVLIAAAYFSIFVWCVIFLVILFLFGKKALILQQNIPQLHEVTTN